jgi:hypothetical protein
MEVVNPWCIDFVTSKNYRSIIARQLQETPPSFVAFGGSTKYSQIFGTKNHFFQKLCTKLVNKKFQ